MKEMKVKSDIKNYIKQLRSGKNLKSLKEFDEKIYEFVNEIIRPIIDIYMEISDIIENLLKSILLVIL